jgi:hypothetical protein
MRPPLAKVSAMAAKTDSTHCFESILVIPNVFVSDSINCPLFIATHLHLTG